MPPLVRYAPFALAILVAVFFSHRFLWLRLIERTQLPDPWRQVGTGLLIALACAWPLGVALPHFIDAPWSRVLAAVGLTWMGLTLLLALPWPLLLWLIGDRLTTAVNATDIVRIAGASANDAAWVALVLSAVRQFLLPGGLADDHLGWAEKPVCALRRHVTWLLAVAPTLVFLLSSMAGLGDERLNESLGRFIYLALLAMFALFAHAVLRLKRGAIPQW